ncbi:DUF748 domain-containing protein [bacterium]|nr:DUF748 domain-containing protein [bacterium]
MTKPPAKQRKPLSRPKKWAIGILVALLLYAVVGFLVAPLIIRSQLAKQLTARTGLSAAVGKVQCNPFSLELAIESLEMGPTNSEAWLGFDRFHANLQLSSLWRWEFVLRDISLDHPHVLAHLDQAGQLNLLQLANKFASPTNAPPGKPFQLPSATIETFAISNAVVRWRDDFIRPGFEGALTGGNLMLTNFDTLATNKFDFSATLYGDMTLRASGGVALWPSVLNVNASATHLQLGRFAQYIPDWSPLRLTNGIVDAQMSAHVAISSNALVATLQDASVQVADFVVTATNVEQPVVQIAKIDLTGLTADLATQTAALGAVRIDQPTLAANRLTNGAIDWQVWLAQITEHLPAGDKNAAPWKWSAGEINATNAVLRVTDAVPAQPVSLAITNAWVMARNLTNDFKQPLPVNLGFALQSGGGGSVSGNITPMPLAAYLELKVDDVFLPIAQPYLNGIVNATLTNGFGSVAGKVRAGLGPTNELTASFAGSVGAHDIAITEKESGERLAGVERADVSGISANWPLAGLKVDSVKVAHPSARLVMHEDKTSNVDNVVSRKILEEVWHQLAAVWNSLQFELNDLTVTNAEVSLTDESIQPPFKSGASDILVELHGLKPNAEVPAKLNVGGKVEGKAPFSVAAEFQPVGTNLTAKVSVMTKVISLPPGSTYAGKWAGYLIDQGKVSVDLRYELNNRFIKGENRVIVDDFEFGSKTGSKDAINLPVKLGVSLLKDRNNRIDLDVPIEGDLSDPKIKLSRVIWRAFANIFEKAITSPFKLLGSLVGAGKDEDLGSVEFVPGSAELATSETGKLDKLAKALYERPQLKLEIVGRFDPVADDAAIRSGKLETELRQFCDGLATHEKFKPLADALEMANPPNREQLIKLLYVKTLEIPFHLPTNPPPVEVVTNSATTIASQLDKPGDATPTGESEVKRSWFGRTWKWLGHVLAPNPISKRNGPAEPAEPKPTSAATSKEVSSPTEMPAPAAVPPEPPPPILPPLPDPNAMEAELLKRVPVTADELAALADQRAKAVQTLLLSKPELTPDRVAIASELSGSEPAAKQARVFLGIQ